MTVRIVALFLFLTQFLSAHELFIKEVVDHTPYLKELRVKSIGDLRLIKSNALNQSMRYSQIKADDVYGIGMPKGLNSELLISAGDLYEGKFEKHHYHAKKLGDEDREIAFLAYTNVKKWRSVKMPENVVNFKQLEETLPLLAKTAGVDTDVPFPFVLKAKVVILQWFIVNGMGSAQPDYLSSFLRNRYIGGLEDIQIEGVGFYAHQHKGILSAPTSSMHIHFRTLHEPLFIGHIDNYMILEKGSEVLFPVE
ncbi:MAG: acetolactate decarboxylase [Epsilonproteobacteria bacterium]|nr:acetolactate decarboxylase [Campylobacterota bacterium]